MFRGPPGASCSLHLCLLQKVWAAAGLRLWVSVPFPFLVLGPWCVWCCCPLRGIKSCCISAFTRNCLHFLCSGNPVSGHSHRLAGVSLHAAEHRCHKVEVVFFWEESLLFLFLSCPISASSCSAVSVSQSDRHRVLLLSPHCPPSSKYLALFPLFIFQK